MRTRIGLRLTAHTYRFEVRLPPLPTIITLRVGEDWQVALMPFHWARARGGWPSHWRSIATMQAGPIFWFWRLGPIEVRRLRAL